MNDESFSGAEYDRLIKPIMITAKIISIWPLAEDSSKRAILFRRIHLFCMFFLVIVMSVAVTADVVHNIDNLDEATECALICTAFYLCVVRLLVYTSHQEDMLYVVNTMRKDWVSSSHEDRAILAERTMFAFRLVKYFISTVASEAVGDSAYGSGWIGSGYCQTLRIMMMRARIPNKITAAKFYAMSLESFSAVLSTSFSYFTVLTATKEE
ncbi:uncharacterized protein LOC122538580 [Frieseomelitta varia]|uniref:uncharacterized protein LOC122538580 n=1 Tax=Frieseomelitta varia TaxID=561572 RepID=UPI001CB6AFF5|nr:uncharacterized protein LOC122538580 [Frieseomelitta varia]